MCSPSVFCINEVYVTILGIYLYACTISGVICWSSEEFIYVLSSNIKFIDKKTNSRKNNKKALGYFLGSLTLLFILYHMFLWVQIENITTEE